MGKKGLTARTRTIAVLIMSSALLLVSLGAVGQTHVQINDVTTTNVTDIAATFTWRTNVSTSARIDFGTTNLYGFYLISGESPRTDHALTITNLSPETTYHYSITAHTTGEQLSTFDRTFKTTKGKDRNGPVISNVSLVYVTGASAAIQWETNENASSVVHYGVTPTYTSNASGAGNTKYHDVVIRNLKIGGFYHFQVESKDKDGNVARWFDRSFSTLLNGEADKVPLQLESIKPITPNDDGLTTDGVVISWRSNKPATGIVRYGPTIRLGKAVTIPGFRSFEHSQLISGLKPDALYYFTVESKDVFGKSLKSDALSFKTKAVNTPVSQYPQGEVPIVLGFSTLDYTAPKALYRVIGGKNIFALLSGQLYRLANIASLHRYDFAHLATRDVSQQVIDRYPLVTLVKATDGNTVYYLYRRPHNRILKFAIPSPSVFASYPYNKWDKIVTLDAEEIAEIPNAQLIREEGLSAIYLLESGKRRLIGESQLQQRGFSTDGVVGVSKKHLEAIPLGNPI